jgi:hypothetical protein
MGRLNVWLNGSNYGANLPVWQAWTVRKGLLFGGILVLLTAVGGTVYALLPHETPRVTVTCVGELGDNYEVMPEREIICKLQDQTNLDIRDLMDKRIKPSTFQNFQDAETSARALYGMGKYHHEAYAKSVDAYAAAESKVTGSGAELNYAFYLAYANAALYAKDKDLYADLTDKAKTAIQNDPTLNDTRKKEELDQIEGMKRILETAD